MRCFIFLSLFSLALQCHALAQNNGGIKGQKAPSITVDEWVNLPEGSKAPSDASLKGKIIYLYCFQSWCPGCHSSGFPTLQHIKKHYQQDNAVQCIAVQTVFEGFNSNRPSRASDMVKKYQLNDIPVGHSGSRNKPSKLMADFRTRGTPWTIIIDANGIVQYNAFHIKPAEAIKLIDRLKK